MTRSAKRAVDNHIFPSFTQRPNKGGGKQPAVCSLVRLPLMAVITTD